MIARRLDANWDYCFGRSKADFLSGTDSVAQAIKSRLLLFLGEWFEDQGDGLPMFQSILGAQGAPRNRSKVDRIILARILGTPNVTKIVKMTSAYDASTRAYSFTAVVDTSFGQVQVSSTPTTILIGGIPR